MATNNQKLLFCLLILNVAVVILTFTGAGESLWDHTKTISKRTLTFLNTTTGSQSFLGGSRQAATPSVDPSHPFGQLSKRLSQFDWDDKRIDEVIRKFWKTDKSFLRYEVDEMTKKNSTFLSTSCLHTAAWIVVGLLELQTRPNYYRGLYKLPQNKDLVVYNNTQKPPSTDAAPLIQSLKSFIASRPADEPILLQFDMYVPQDPSSYYYVDHHFALHIYNGQVSLYHSWQGIFNLIDWMKTLGSHKFRYPMPIDTFLAHFETFLKYTDKEDERRNRLEATWKIFGITQSFTYGRKEVLDPVVRNLRLPWVISLITHWPSPRERVE